MSDTERPTTDLTPAEPVVLTSADLLNKPPKLRELLRRVATRATHKWNRVGLELEIDYDRLNAITHQDAIQCYVEVFRLWQRKADPPFTWATFLDVLRSPLVEENALAQEIEEWLITDSDGQSFTTTKHTTTSLQSPDMMAAVHRRDTDVEDREEMISHLKKELEELRREGVERKSPSTREVQDLKSKLAAKTDELSELVEMRREEEIESDERESRLTKKIEDLRSKLTVKTDELTEALKTSNSELSSQLLEEWKKSVSEVASNVAVQTRQEPVPLPTGLEAACNDNPKHNGPTVQLLLKELKDVVDNWKPVGVTLGVPVRKLNNIKLSDQFGGVENWKIQMFDSWLKYKPDASWKDVVQALEENDYKDLAATLWEKYLPDQAKEVRKKVVGTDVQSHTREVVDKPPAAPQSVSDSAVQTVLDKNKPILAGTVLLLMITIGFAISLSK